MSAERMTLPMLPELPELTEDDLDGLARFALAVTGITELLQETIAAFAAMVPSFAIADVDAALRRVYQIFNELEFERRYQHQRMRKQRRVRRGQ